MIEQAARVGLVLQRQGLTLAVAESLTGGMMASTFAQAPSASEWFQGGVVAYSSAVKHNLLQVPPGSVVSEAAAASMAEEVARLLQSDVALAVTGVGGPGSQDGRAPGTVWVATWPVELGSPVLLRLHGNPGDICEQVCVLAADILHQRLEP